MPQKQKTSSDISLKLVPDVPLGEFGESARAQLGFEQYSQVLANAALNTPGPFTIGVFGQWGTGKSSLLRKVKHRFDDVDDSTRGARRPVTVWFNAWQFEQDPNPIVPLVATIMQSLTDEKGTLQKGSESIARALRAIAYGFTLKAKFNFLGAGGEADFSAKDMIDRYGQISDPLLERSLFHDAFKLLDSATSSEDSPKIVVFIDDLDRCLLDKALNVIEYIKLVLSQRGFIFFLGLDRRIIEGYLEKRFRKDFEVQGFSGREYLDKIVQLSFPIPSHASRLLEFTSYVIDTHVDQGSRSDLREIAPLIALACTSNPRAVIRLINNLLVDRAIDNLDGQRTYSIEMLFYSRILQENRLWEGAFGIVTHEDFNGSKFLDFWRGDSVTTGRGFEALKSIIEGDELLSQMLSHKLGTKYLKSDDLRRNCARFYKSQREVESEPSDFRTRSARSATGILNLLPRVDLQGENLDSMILDNVDMHGANFSKASMRRTSIRGARLREANFSNANLAEADFRESNLRSARFDNASMVGTMLQDADLSDAVLVLANLEGAYLYGSTLAYTNMRRAILRRANLEQARFISTDIRGADLRDAIVNFALFDSDAEFESIKRNVKWDETTIWPNGKRYNRMTGDELSD